MGVAKSCRGLVAKARRIYLFGMKTSVSIDSRAETIHVTVVVILFPA